MAKPIRAIAKPELIRWVREDAGLLVEDAARRVNVSPDRLQSWELGEAQPTIAQLRKLAEVCKRPLAVLYLSRPPKHFQALRDFRRLPGKGPPVESPQLRAEVRRARFRREVAIELLESLEEPVPQLRATIRLDDEPEQAGRKLRSVLAVSVEEQQSWKDQYRALRAWRSALEAAGVMVLQTTTVPRDECRGFSISEFPLPVIVTNESDSPRGRIFTMLHELAHVLLRRGGVCDLDEQGRRPPEEQQIEVFCNYVAGAALVPRAEILAEVGAGPRRPSWPDEELRRLSEQFSVSREVVLRRLVTLGRATQAFYQQKRAQFQREYEEYLEGERRKRKEKGGTGPPPYRRAVGSAGPYFTRLVLDSYRREKITSSDVTDFLDIRWKHIPKIEEAVFEAVEVAS
jgi:Zn-dependent peptidase ImmA (M78 family)/DNA-binding XRE family transcriptional regulator